MREFIISNGTSKAVVSSLGGTIISSNLMGMDIFCPWRKIGDKERGGCPICAPWFGSSPRESKKHGYLRDMEACAAKISPNKVELMFDYVGHQNYPWVLKYAVGVEVRLNGSLLLSLTITRMKDGIKEKAPILPGFHPYFISRGQDDVIVSVAGKLYEMFPKEAQLVSMDGRIVRIYTPRGNIQMELCEGFSVSKKPKLALWTDSLKEYVCVEPIVQDNKLFESPDGFYLEESDSMKFSVLFSVL